MGLKLGLMMHWAPGCQMGTYESWPLSDGDGSWSQKDVDWTDIETFKQEYIDCNKTFNPVKFRPDPLRAGLAVKDILIKGWLRAIDGSDKVLESILITETPDRGIAMAVLVPGRGPII